MKNSISDFIIIGAGISGLTLAVELAKKGKRVKVLEKSSEVGGLIKTKIFDGLRIDSGPHLFHTANPKVLEYWRSLVGEKLVEKDFFAANFINGEFHDYPVNLESLRSNLSAKLFNQVTSELLKSDTERAKSSTSYHEYVRNIAGNFLAETYFTKYPEKLWGISTTELSARFAPKRIQIREKRMPFHSGPGKFAGVIEGGCGELCMALQKQFEANFGTILFKKSVESVGISKNRVISVNTTHESISTKNQTIISTIPLDKTAELFGLSSGLYYRSCFCIVYVLKRDPFPADYDWLYFPGSNPVFHRAGIQSRFSRVGIPDGTHILCCEIAYTDTPTDAQIDSWVTSSLEFFCMNKFFSFADVLSTTTINLGPVYPGLFAGYENEVANLKGELSAYENFHILGSLAEYEYSDAQVLTSKAIELADHFIRIPLSQTESRQKPWSSSPNKKGKSNSIQLKCGNNLLGSEPGSPTFVIAEIGLAHNGSIDMCIQLIDQAKHVGFDAVKLQTYRENRLSDRSGLSTYYEETLDQDLPLSAILNERILSIDNLREVFEYADKVGITLFSTPFDAESVDLLEKVKCPFYKISSMDVLNVPLLRSVGKTNKTVILSTGMASFSEIGYALETLRIAGATDVALLHCVSAYPCPIPSANLGRIRKLQDAFGLIVGYSDHTEDAFTPAVAVALGAKIIEKHVTLDRGMSGPDHHFSLTYNSMRDMIRNIRLYEKALSFNEESIGNIETISRRLLRRSLYVKEFIQRGEVLSELNIDVRSPADGICPSNYDQVIGKRATRSLEKDSPLLHDDILWS